MTYTQGCNQRGGLSNYKQLTKQPLGRRGDHLAESADTEMSLTIILANEFHAVTSPDKVRQMALLSHFLCKCTIESLSYTPDETMRIPDKDCTGWLLGEPDRAPL
ncbi:hypothetical protein J6590_067700 [Homalodisca vitripennis]|nr:hypothetical protein J6590_067700 [Homalodisca vitripennis]